MVSQRQLQVLEAIARFVAEHGYPPSMRDLGKALGIASTNAVSDHLNALERKGLISRDKTKSRGVSLSAEGSELVPQVTPPSTLRVPLVGSIAAGQPILAEERVERFLQVDSSMFPRGSSTGLFALRVKGDSMIEAGIHNNDIIFARAQNHAQQGAIVVALVEDSATVKRFYREPDGIRLQPENSAMKPIVITEQSAVNTAIQGVVVAVLRVLQV